MKILTTLLTVLTVGLITTTGAAASNPKVLPPHIQAMFSKPAPGANPLVPPTATPGSAVQPAAAANDRPSIATLVAAKPVIAPMVSAFNPLKTKIPTMEKLATTMLESNAQVADIITLLATIAHTFPTQYFLDDDFTRIGSGYLRSSDDDMQRSHAFEANQYIASVYQLICDSYDVALERPRQLLIALAEATRATYAAHIELNAQQRGGGATTPAHPDDLQKVYTLIPLLHLAEYGVHRATLAGANKSFPDIKGKDNYSKRRWCVLLMTLLADAAVGAFLYSQTKKGAPNDTLLKAPEYVAATRMVQHLMAEILGRRLRSKTRDNAGFLLQHTPA